MATTYKGDPLFVEAETIEAAALEMQRQVLSQDRRRAREELDDDEFAPDPKWAPGNVYALFHDRLKSKFENPKFRVDG